MSKTVTLINHVFQQVLSTSGYKKINYAPNCVRNPLYVHRLIALTFVDGYQDGFQVNHKNGIKTDNRPENLEWVTTAQNVVHAWKAGLAAKRGEKSAQAKLTNKDIKHIRKLADNGMKISYISKQYPQVHYSLIGMIVRRERWTHI